MPEHDPQPYDADDSALDALSDLSSSEGSNGPDTVRIPAEVDDGQSIAQVFEADVDFDVSVWCPACNTPRLSTDHECIHCGWSFTSADNQPEPPLIHERYLLGDLISERRGVSRFRGFDMQHGGDCPLPIVIIRQPLSTPATSSRPAVDDTPSPAQTKPISSHWPSIGWERRVLTEAEYVSLPRVMDRFVDDQYEYLIEEMPLGQSLWDAWDDPQFTAHHRFGWMIELTVTLARLYNAGALLEELRPEMVVVTPGGQHAVIARMEGLIPMPLTPDVLLRGSPYTAPELILSPQFADGRAGIYAFGALLYSLYLGRELTDLDFTAQGMPQPFLDRFPDAHPLIGRLIGKTFTRDFRRRFPTDDGAIEDPTGFRDLLQALSVCQRQIGRVRYEISAWTTTGMYRSGNEDAFAVVHSADGHQDDADELALLLLTDGMGGMDAGEVAATMTVQILRTELLRQPPFAILAASSSPTPRSSSFAQNMLRAASEDTTPLPLPVALPASGSSASAWGHPNFTHRNLLLDPAAREVEACKDRILLALKEANRQVYTAARNGLGPRGMGCTAEVIHLDGSMAVIGHVGDSRVYHLSQGRFTQITRDHTLVNRLIELGQLTPEEAEYHPRRAELQQAIGGRPDVDPELYSLHLKAGDWLLVCSDGLTNQLRPDRILAVLQRASNAEKAARLLVNLANLDGATDNVTVITVRIIGP